MVTRKFKIYMRYIMFAYSAMLQNVSHDDAGFTIPKKTNNKQTQKTPKQTNKQKTK